MLEEIYFYWGGENESCLKQTELIEVNVEMTDALVFLLSKPHSGTWMIPVLKEKCKPQRKEGRWV